MRKKLFYVIKLTTLMIMSCQKADLPATGSVSGQITSKNGSGVSTPLTGTKLYLWNLSLKFDSIKPNYKKKAVADSAFTDNQGNYSIKNIPEGKWGIAPDLPMPSTFGNIQTTGDSVVFDLSNTKKEFIVNFQLNPPDNNLHKGHFHMSFVLEPKFNGRMEIYRRNYTVYKFFFEEWWRYNDARFDDKATTTEFSADYGCYYFLSLLTNNFVFKFYEGDVFVFEAYVDYLLTNCPEASTYNVDIRKKTCTWVKNSIDGMSDLFKSPQILPGNNLRR